VRAETTGADRVEFTDDAIDELNRVLRGHHHAREPTER